MKTLANEADAVELLERLRTVREESARRWGKMSSHQMVCHLIDGFRMMTGERKASPATGVLQQTAIKWIALYLPVTWPAGIRTRPEIDQQLGGTRPSMFAADVKALEERIEQLLRQPARFEDTHPIFGRLSTSAWLRWAYLHMDHHLRQFGA